jgi:hypothetical protein
VDEIFGQLLGSALGHIASTSIKADYEKQLEESLAKSPATFIIPASVIVNVKAETIDKHVYIRIRTDEGKVFSIVKGDPFMSEKNWSNLENAIWLMRHAYERFYFFGTLLYLHLPEQKRSEIFVEYVKEFFGTKGVSEKLHEKIDALLKTQGTSWGRLEGERQYHMQRWLKSKWGEQLKHEYKWLDEVKEYYPLCFACKVNAKRSKAKYCQQCGLSMC